MDGAVFGLLACSVFFGGYCLYTLIMIEFYKWYDSTVSSMQKDYGEGD